MAKRKLLTPNQQLYAKQQKRLKNAVKRIESRGYNVNFKVPEMPKRVTQKAIRDISELTTRNIYAQSTYGTQKHYISGFRRRELERKQSAQKGKETRLKNVYKTNPAKFAKDLGEFIDIVDKSYAEADKKEAVEKFIEKYRPDELEPTPSLPEPVVDYEPPVDFEPVIDYEPTDVYFEEPDDSFLDDIQDAIDTDLSTVDDVTEFLTDLLEQITEHYGELPEHNSTVNMIVEMLKKIDSYDEDDADELEYRLDDMRDEIETTIDREKWAYVSRLVDAGVGEKVLQPLFVAIFGRPMSIGDIKKWL